MNDSQLTLWPKGWQSDHLTLMAQADRHVAGLSWKAIDASLVHHLQVLAHATTANEFLDAKLGQMLVGACQALVKGAATRDNLEQTWIRMAVGYVLDTDDCAPDLTALGGLDDDADVVLALLDSLGAVELAGPIRKHLRR
jgi:hypothetical protein